jgi:hypothetical protein
MADRPLSMSKSSWSSASDWGPNLDPFPDAGEPLSRKAEDLWYYPDGVYNFLFRFAVVATIFLLAVWIAYLAR